MRAELISDLVRENMRSLRGEGAIKEAMKSRVRNLICLAVAGKAALMCFELQSAVSIRPCQLVNLELAAEKCKHVPKVKQCDTIVQVNNTADLVFGSHSGSAAQSCKPSPRSIGDQIYQIDISVKIVIISLFRFLT